MYYFLYFYILLDSSRQLNCRAFSGFYRKMEFESLLRKEQVMIEEIIRSGRQVMNSGIRIA